MVTKYLLGIDLGGTQLRFALAHQKTGQIILKKSYLSPFVSNANLSQFRNLTNSEKVNAYIINNLQEYLKQAKLNHKQIAGIGISVAGKVFPDKTFIGANMPKKFAKKIGNKYAINLISTLKKIFTTQIEIENDANCAGIAQSIYYAQKGIDPNTTFFVTVSTGIGGGGPKKDLDEIGHMQIDGYFPGVKPLCGCGAYGCIEAFASGEGIRKQTLTILDMYLNRSPVFKQFVAYEKIRTDNKYDLAAIVRKSKLINIFKDKQELNAKIIFELAYQKNPDLFAYYLTDTAADRLAKTLINISRVHDIERFGLAGSVITNNQQYIKVIQKKIDHYNTNCILSQKIKVELAPLGDYTADYGALFLVVEPKYQANWVKTILRQIV